jgi:ankyrin repeat protein
VKIVQVEGRAWKPAGKSKVKKFKKPKSKPATNADKTAALSKKLFKSEKAAEVKALLQAGADANARDNDGFQPLHLPNFLRQSSIVKLLLDHGADVNGKTANEKETPLMIAACYGLLPTVELLLSAGAAVELKDQSGHTALVHAVCGLLIQNIKPNEKIVQSLLKAGARITPEVMIQAGMDSTPKIVQLLLDRGGDVNAAKAGKWTALSSAIYMRNVGIVKSLLKAGADPNCMVYQQTALAAAQQSGNAAIARALREAHAK